MKNVKKIKRGFAIVLAIVIALSSFSMIGVSAATATPDEATPDEVQTISLNEKTAKISTGADDNTYKIWADSSYGMRWNQDKYLPFTFTNQITGKKVTYPKNFGAIEYEYAHNTKTGKNTAVWCIQPGVVIMGADYYAINSKKANKEYWKMLCDKPKVKDAISQIVAFGKAKGGTSKSSPYYYAVYCLLYDIIQKNRGTTAPYSVESEKKSNIEKTVNTVSSKRVEDVKKAAKDILNNIKNMEQPIKNYLSKSEDSNVKLFKTIKGVNGVDGAEDAAKGKYQNKQSITITGEKSNNKITFDKTKFSSNGKFEKLYSYYNSKDEDDKINISIVNENGNSTDNTKKLKFSMEKSGKISVTLDSKTSSINTNNIYFIKISKTPNAKGSKSNSLWSGGNNRQTMLNSISYDVPTYTAYFPIRFEISRVPTTPNPTTPTYGSLKIKKSFSIGTSENYDEGASELNHYWYFKVDYTSNKKATTQIINTDYQGNTPSISAIDNKTKVTITELGEFITKSKIDSRDGFKQLTYIEGKGTYGYPDNFNVGSVSSDDVELSRSASSLYTYSFTLNSTKDGAEIEVDWENIKDNEMKFQIIKETTDNSPVDGYYFFVFDSNKKVIEPTILGPTDSEGKTDVIRLKGFYNLSNLSGLYVLELGKLKNGYSPSNIERHPENYITDVFLLTGRIRQMFEIPPQYKIEHDTSLTSVGTDQLRRLSLSKADYKEYLEDTKGYKFSYTYINRTEGMIKIRKTDSVTGKDVENATYGIYEYNVDDYDGPPAEETNSDTPENDEPQIVAEDDISDEGEIEEGDSDITDAEATGTREPIATLVTKKGGYVYSKLIPTGTYYLKEIASPNNYALDTEKHQFTLEAGHNTEDTALIVDFDGSGTIKDKPTYVRFNKVEASSLSSNGKQLAGATIAIYEKPQSGTIDYNTAKAVYEFITTDKAENIIGLLETGKTYVAHEKSCPDGYCLADDVEFTVSTDGKIDDVTMKDNTTKIEIQKLSKKDNKCLAGVTLQIRNMGNEPVKVKDYNGNIVDHWVTTDKPLVIEGMLQAGNTYQLVELSTLPGYVTAEPVIFTVNKNDEVKIVTMYNDTTKYEFSKRKLTGTEEVPGCHMSIREKGKDTNIREWISTDEPYRLEGVLVAGKTYILTEINPADGLTTAESIEFRVGYNSELHTIVMKDDVTKIEFNKIAGNTNKPLANCVLSLTDSNGKEVKRWTTTDKAYRLDGVLAVGKTYTLTEISAAEDYMKAEPVTFTVRDTNEVQTVTMIDKKYAHPDLPVTGGNGLIPFIFAVIGISAFAGAFIVFVIKKKRTDKEK